MFPWFHLQLSSHPQANALYGSWTQDLIHRHCQSNDQEPPQLNEWTPGEPIHCHHCQHLEWNRDPSIACRLFCNFWIPGS